MNRLTVAQMRDITTGAADIAEENGRIRFLRFSEAEAAVIQNPNSLCPAGIQMEFETDASALRLCVHVRPAYTIRTYFSLDVFLNGQPLGSLCNFREEECAGNYAERTYLMGEFSGEFPLGAGKKQVRIVFPHSAVAEIIKMELTDCSCLIPVRRKKTLVAYGDSITQGYDALHPSHTYAMRLADALDAALYNKALGGAIFAPALADAARDIPADCVLVAYGTNDWGAQDEKSFRETADAFLDAIAKRYPHIPTVVLTPIWRKDHTVPRTVGAFSHVAEILQELCGKYADVTVVSGWDLVPHDEGFFADLYLHPNDAGFSHYCKNLLKEIRRP